MGFVFRGYDENGVPRYDYVPNGDQKAEPPAKAADIPEKFEPLDAASDFCTARGGTIDGTNCRLPDGTTCEMQAFYNGTCGSPVVPLHLAVGAIAVAFATGYFFSLMIHD